MNKSVRLISRAFALLALVALCGCGNQSSDDADGATGGANVGSLEGKAVFSNARDSSGITVSIEKSDGALTASMRSALSGDVSRARAAVAARNAVTVSAGADGAFKFVTLEPGTYTVEAYASVSDKKSVRTNVVVEAGKSTSVGTLELTAVGRVSGTVKLDGAASGNMGFLVFVAGTSYMAVTDDSGSFTIDDVPVKSDYSVVVSKNGYMLVWGTANVAAGATADMGTKAIAASDLSAVNSYLVWKGSLSAAPANPQANWAYFNVVDNKLYVYNGASWGVFAQTLNGDLSGYHTVTFDSKGGTSLASMYTDTVGSDILALSYSGHALVGWYASADLAESSKVTFPYVPASDVTLYARWIPATDGFLYVMSATTPGYAVYPGTAVLLDQDIIPDYWQGLPVTEIADNSFTAKKTGGTLTLPAGLIRIGTAAFSQCGFALIGNLPTTLKIIASNAFEGASIRGSFQLPYGLTEIGPCAFKSCALGGVALVIPETVTSLAFAGGAFSGCGISSLTIPSAISVYPTGLCSSSTGLHEVRINAVAPPTIGSDTFKNCASLTAIKVPAGSVDAYKTAAGWVDYATKIVSQ